ncbi:MAG: Flp family type IVb pilin [Chloroflexi bacterium]|nr:Flp family type IVb pilin [Chloroflexota bacterium]
MYLRLRNWLVEQQEGQGLIEYAILVAVIAVAVIVTLIAIGGWVSNTFGDLNNKLQNVQ